MEIERRGDVTEIESQASGGGAARRLVRGGSIVVRKLGAYVSGKRELEEMIRTTSYELSARVDRDLVMLSGRIDGLALDQSRFIDALTEQVQALTDAVNRLQLRLDESSRSDRDQAD